MAYKKLFKEDNYQGEPDLRDLFDVIYRQTKSDCDRLTKKVSALMKKYYKDENVSNADQDMLEDEWMDYIYQMDLDEVSIQDIIFLKIAK